MNEHDEYMVQWLYAYIRAINKVTKMHEEALKKCDNLKEQIAIIESINMNSIEMATAHKMIMMIKEDYE